MTTSNSASIEEQDAQRIQEAVAAINKNDVKTAVRLLMEVASRTPKPYVREFEADGKRFIRFWDAEEFIHFSTSQHLEGQQIVWLKCAYPLAWYYLGFCCVKAADPQRAIEFLDAGYQLEAHPMLLLEKGRALGMLKKHQEAIAVFDAAFELAKNHHARMRAMALRGKGVQLIDMNQLELAEQILKSSLELEPGNAIALNELKYIAQLRSGGRTVAATVIPTTGAGASGLPSATSGAAAQIPPPEPPPAPPAKKPWWKVW